MSLSIRGTESEEYDLSSIEDALADHKRAFIRRGRFREDHPPPMVGGACGAGPCPPPRTSWPRWGESIVHAMPMNWMNDVLSSGRAHRLDGVDEPPEQRRREARQRLQKLLTAYPARVTL